MVALRGGEREIHREREQEMEGKRKKDKERGRLLVVGATGALGQTVVGKKKGRERDEGADWQSSGQPNYGSGRDGGWQEQSPSLLDGSQRL